MKVQDTAKVAAEKSRVGKGWHEEVEEVKLGLAMVRGAMQ